MTFLRGLCYVIHVPPWQSPDETTHFQLIRELVSPNNADIQKEIEESTQKFHFFEIAPNLDTFGSIRFLGPPLYHFIASSLIKIFHISDIMTQFYFCRLLSLIFGMGIVFITWLTARLIFPEHSYMWTSSALLVSLIPQFNLISSSVNYDSLANFLGSFFVLGAIAIIKHGLRFNLLTLTGAAICLGLITKRISVIFILLWIVIPFLHTVEKPITRILHIAIFYIATFIGGILLWSLMKIIFLYPLDHTIDVLISSKRQFTHIIEFSSIFLTKIGWVKFHEHLFITFWGVFGWLRFPLHGIWYYLIAIIVMLSMYGLYKSFARYCLISNLSISAFLSSPHRKQLLFLAGCVLLCYIGVYFYEGLVSQELPQGRYLFIVLTPIVILLTYGLSKVSLLKKYGGVLPWAMGFFLLLDIVCLLQYVFPAFHFFYANIQGNIFI